MRKLLLCFWLALGLDAQIYVNNAIKIRGRAIQNCAPSQGQVLAYNATNNDWECTNLGSSPTLDSATVTTQLALTNGATLKIYSAGNTAFATFAHNGSTVTNTGGFQLGGSLTWATDNTWDVGASGANRPRNLYLGGYVNAAGAGTFGGLLTANGQFLVSPSNVNWVGTATIVSQALTGSSQSYGATILLQSGRASTAVQSQDWLGYLAVGGHDGTQMSSGWNGGTQIVARAEENWSSGAHGASLHFYTTATGTTNSADRWQMAPAGHLFASTDNSFDIGASGANRPRNLYLAGTVLQYNGVSTVANGLEAIVAKTDATAQASNIAGTTVYAVPVGGAGFYRFSCYTVVTQAATTSATLPGCGASWTDNDTSASASANAIGSYVTNTVGINGNYPGSGTGSVTINAKASTNIQFYTYNYASSGATGMQYAVHVKLQYLGN